MGDDVEVIDELLSEPEEFVRLIYGLPKVKWSMMLITWSWRRRLAKKKLSQESFPEIPPLAGYDWTYSNGFPEPEWSDGPILPSQPDDLLGDATKSTTQIMNHW